MAKKSVAQRLVEFGGWLVSHVPPFLIGPLSAKTYAECLGLEPDFEAYMADSFNAWEFNEVDIAAFQSEFVFPS